MSSSQLWENSDGEEDDLPYPPSSPRNLQGTSVPLFTDQWQDSLALSSYLKLRRDTAANTSTQGGIGGASTDASPARPGFQAPLSASTGNTVPSFLNQFIMKPLLDSAKKPGQMRNIDQISVIDPETSFLSTTSRQTNNADDFLRSAIPRDDGDDLFAMADDDDGNQHGNMDKMGLKLLLRTALRDKDIANHRIHQLNDSIHHIEVEKQHLLQQSQSVYAIHASANRWKLPIIVLWCYQQFEIRQCTKAWQRWQRKIHLQKTHTLQQHQHQLIINIAKKNLMKVRNTKQQIAFIRWKCWQQYQVQQELFNNRLLQKFRKQHLQRFHFQFWKQFAYRNQLLKKVIYRCKSYRKMRMSFQRWRQLPHRHQRREDRHKLQQLTCLHLLQHQQRQQSQLKHSWLLWKQHVTYQHRVMTRRQLFVMMLKKNHWHQSTLWYCFTRWKARIIYQLPKLTRLCHCLHQGYHRMYRKAWKQWKANVALDRLKHMTLHRMVKTVHKKEVVNKVSHAFHQWRHSLCEQKMAIYHKHHVMMKSQHQRLSVSLVHVVYLHCLRRTWCQWKSFSTLSTTNNKYSHQLDDVKHANHSLRQTITQSSHQYQDLLQQYQDLQHRQQRLHHKTSLQRLQSYFRCAYFLHIQDVFAKWKAFSNSTLLQHRYQHQLTMIRHHQLLQQSDVVTKRHQDHVYRMVWQQWYRGCRQVKTLRRISASFVRYDVAARLKQRFDCWHRQTQSQRQVQRVLHVMLNKTRSHAQRYYWHLWKSQVYIQQRHQHLLQHAVLCLKKAHSFQVVHAFFRWKQSLYQQEVQHWRHDCNLWRRLSEQQVLRRHYTAWRDVIKRRQLSHKYLRRCTLRQHQHQIQKTFAIWKRFARFQQHRQHAVQSIAYLSVRKQHQAITISHQRSQQEVCFHHWKYHCFTRHRVQIGEDLEGKYQQCLPVMQSLRLSLQHLQLQHDLLTTQHSDLNVDMQHQEDLQFRILQKYHQFQCKYRIFRQWYQRIQCYRKITSWQQKTSRKVIQSTLWRWKYAYAQQRLMTSNQIYVQDVVQQFSAKKTLQRLWHYWKEYLLETRFALLQREEHVKEKSRLQRDVKRCFHLWLARYQSIQWKKQVLIRHCWAQWKHQQHSKQQTSRILTSFAKSINKGWIRKVFRKWQSNTTHSHTLQLRLKYHFQVLLHRYEAGTVHSYRLSIAKYWRQWKQVIQQERIELHRKRVCQRVVVQYCLQPQLTRAWRTWLAFAHIHRVHALTHKHLLTRFKYIFLRILYGRVQQAFLQWKQGTHVHYVHRHTQLQHHYQLLSTKHHKSILKRSFMQWSQTSKQVNQQSWRCKKVEDYDMEVIPAWQLTSQYVYELYMHMIQTSGNMKDFLRIGEALFHCAMKSSSAHGCRSNSAFKCRLFVVNGHEGSFYALKQQITGNTDHNNILSPFKTVHTEMNMKDLTSTVTSTLGNGSKSSGDELHSEKNEEEFELYLLGEGMVGQCAESQHPLVYYSPVLNSSASTCNNGKPLPLLVLIPILIGSPSTVGGAAGVVQCIGVMQFVNTEVSITDYDMLILRNQHNPNKFHSMSQQGNYATSTMATNMFQSITGGDHNTMARKQQSRSSYQNSTLSMLTYACLQHLHIPLLNVLSLLTSTCHFMSLYRDYYLGMYAPVIGMNGTLNRTKRNGSPNKRDSTSSPMMHHRKFEQDVAVQHSPPSPSATRKSLLSQLLEVSNQVDTQHRTEHAWIGLQSQMEDCQQQIFQLQHHIIEYTTRIEELEHVIKKLSVSRKKHKEHEEELVHSVQVKDQQIGEQRKAIDSLQRKLKDLQEYKQQRERAMKQQEKQIYHLNEVLRSAAHSSL